MYVFDEKQYLKYRDYRLSQPKPDYMDIHFFIGGAFSVIINSVAGYVRNMNKGDVETAQGRLNTAKDMLEKLGDRDAIETYKMIVIT